MKPVPLAPLPKVRCPVCGAECNNLYETLMGWVHDGPNGPEYCVQPPRSTSDMKNEGRHQ